MKSSLHMIFVGALALSFTGHASALCIASTGVSSDTPSNGIPSSTYEYTVINGCSPEDQPMLDDFFLPYFPDAGISNIEVPEGWTYSIEPGNDIFNLPNAGVIEFDADTPFGYYGSNGFSYTADYDVGIDGPFAMDLTKDGGSYRIFGDPLIPASPEAVAALGTVATPEPSLVALLSLGVGALIAYANHRGPRGRSSVVPSGSSILN